MNNKIKVAYITNCYECPYCTYDEGFNKHICLIRWNDLDLSTNESIVSEETLISKIIPEECPLDDSC